MSPCWFFDEFFFCFFFIKRNFDGPQQTINVYAQPLNWSQSNYSNNSNNKIDNQALWQLKTTTVTEAKATHNGNRLSTVNGLVEAVKIHLKRKNVGNVLIKHAITKLEQTTHRDNKSCRLILKKWKKKWKKKEQKLLSLFHSGAVFAVPMYFPKTSRIDDTTNIISFFSVFFSFFFSPHVSSLSTELVHISNRTLWLPSMHIQPEWKSDFSMKFRWRQGKWNELFLKMTRRFGGWGEFRVGSENTRLAISHQPMAIDYFAWHIYDREKLPKQQQRWR